MQAQLGVSRTEACGHLMSVGLPHTSSVPVMVRSSRQYKHSYQHKGTRKTEISLIISVATKRKSLSHEGENCKGMDKYANIQNRYYDVFFKAR